MCKPCFLLKRKGFPRKRFSCPLAGLARGIAMLLFAGVSDDSVPKTVGIAKLREYRFTCAVQLVNGRRVPRARELPLLFGG